MVGHDIILAFGGFVPLVLLCAMKSLEFNDSTCKVMHGVLFYGRIGSSVSVVILAVERNAALSFPTRYVT